MTTVQVPSRMYAWKGKAGGKAPYRVEVPVPELQSDDVLIKVAASGVCHSDCFILEMPFKPPTWQDEFTMGHEGSGTIVRMGDQVAGFSIGQEVVVLCTPGCNQPTCTECSRGYHRVCQAARCPGLGFDGVFAQYVAVKPWGIVPLPSGIPHEIAAVSADAVLTAYHAVKTVARLKPGQTIAIFGLGGVGFNALQIANYIGAGRILVADKRKECTSEAMKFGVAQDDVFEGSKDMANTVTSNGIMVDAICDFVGTEETFNSAQMILRPAGIIVLTGLFGQSVPLSTFSCMMKLATIKSTYNGTRDELIECLDLISRGSIQPRVETGSIDSLSQVLKDLDEGKIKSRMVLMAA